MKKLALFSLSALIALACAAPTDGGPSDVGDGDGDGDNGAGNSTGSGGLVSNTGGLAGTGGAGAGTGGAVAGTGGAVAGTGGAIAGSGGSTAGPVTCSGAGFTVNNGYADNGQLCGYAWTATFPPGGTATVDPPCGDSGGECFAGGELCATGNIPAEGTTYPGIMIGWNIAQGLEGGANGSWTVTGSGITPTFTTTGTGEVRIVVNAGAQSYCAVATSGVAIPWTSFVGECWTGGAMSPALSAGTAIDQIALQLNSTAMPQPTAELCLNGIAMN